MIYYLASCIGLVFILKYGTILKFLRNALNGYSFFNELFKCSLCLGFWAGAIHIPIMMFCEGVYAKFLLMPTISAFACWGADSLVQAIQAFDVYCMSNKKHQSESI